MSLETLILDQLTAKPQMQRCLIGYSGGLDSSVLLDLVVKANRQLAEPKAIVAVHINHGLSPNAKKWQQHCEKTAKALGIDCVIESVDVINQGQGLEAAAREQRYRVFSELMNATTCLLTAHHQDDQSETFLLRLLRGTGVQGLGAITGERRFSGGKLLRPLLKIPKVELEDYAHRCQLQWVDDESNQDDGFDRNFLRNKVLPLLNSRWKQLNKRLVATAERLQSSQQLLNDLAAIDLQTLALKTERYGISLDYLALKHLSVERMNNCLRYCCLQQGFSQPNVQQLQEIHRQFFSQESMLTQALVRWGAREQSCEMRQFNQRLYLMPTLPSFESKDNQIHWSPLKNAVLNLDGYGAGQITTVRSISANNSVSIKKLQAADVITIRWRQGGERCRPVVKQHSQQLKKLLQEYQLETWLRDRVPLLYVDNAIAAVGDTLVCADFAAIDEDDAITLAWSLAPLISQKEPVYD